MSAIPPEAFALLVLEDTSLEILAKTGQTESGVLALECVTVARPDTTDADARDVYLVLRLNATETPLDPDRIVERTDGPGTRTYKFYGTQTDPTDLRLTFHLPPDGTNPGYTEDLETFEGILTQYHTELRGGTHSPTTSSPTSTSPSATNPPTSLGNVKIGGAAKGGDKDLRGHLVMIDENTGEVVGQVEDRFRIREDPAMHEKGHENDPVVIEVSEESPAESDANALEAFARVVPPDQQNWITKSATIVSHAISISTNLVVTTITAASNYYVNHSTPSPHRSQTASPVPSTTSRDGKDPAGGGPGAPPPLPPRPRALVFLTSERTRKGLQTVHAVSGEAVKVSAKTVGFIDGMIRRAMGAKPKRDRTAFLRAAQAHGQPIPVSPSGSTSSSASVSSSSKSVATSSLAPPPYSYDVGGGSDSGSGIGNSKGGPPLPARRPTSPAPPPLPPRDNPRPLSNKDRVLISADLILSTIDHSTRQLLDAGTVNLGKVMEHKYGPEAAQSSTLIANTARNVGLVYVDMRGIGRRALLKRAGRTYVKSKFSSGRSDPLAEAQAAQAVGTPVPAPAKQ